MFIKNTIDEWDENPLTNWLNKLTETPQPVPKGRPFRVNVHILPEDEFPEFKNLGRRITKQEAEMPW